MQQWVETLAAVAVGTCALLAGNPAPYQATLHSGHMEHRFDNPERYARSFDDPARDVWQMPEHVVASLGLRPDMAVADIGAGTGYFAKYLARSVPRGKVFAVDIEPAMLGYLEQRAASDGLDNVVTVLAEADDPKLPKPVDRVLIVNTYHHLPERVAYFSRLRPSLADGARVVVIDFRKESPSGPPAAYRFPPEQIEGEMREAGYRLVESHDFLPRQHFLVFEPVRVTP
jgi:ubiquinone/menaquinone biosynthesis C-methylase UbiE